MYTKRAAFVIHVCPKSLLEDWLVPERSPFEWHFFNLGVFALFQHKTL